MSLVACYGSSDDESGEESQTEINNLDGSNINTNGLQQKENANSNVEISKLSNPQNDNIHTNDESVNTWLKGLPAPKTTPLAELIPDDDLEDEVKPKASQIAGAPKPPPIKSRNPVKITIPTLEYDSDEEGEPRQKKQKRVPQSGKTGLTAILPPPIHSSTKESNRTLLPYVFTKKKPTDSKSTVNTTKEKSKPAIVMPSVPTAKPVSLIGAYGSDSDEEYSDKDTNESSNFFSLDSEMKPIKETRTSNFFSVDSDIQSKNTHSTTESNFFSLEPSVQSPELFSQTPVQSNVAKINFNLPPPIKSVQTNMEVDISQSLVSTENLIESAGTKDVVNTVSTMEDAPLTFKSSIKTPYRNPPSRMSYSTFNYGIDTGSATDTVGPTMYGMNTEVEGYSNAEDLHVLQQDKEFLRLQGKPQHGKEPIEFVDVNADDFTSTTEYQKALSEETEYRSSHKKNDGPTSQQKRKHQITYLAHQAKERELELKNAWSQGRMTKKQTQAKYGF